MTPATRDRLSDNVEEGLALGVPEGKTVVFVGSDDIVADEAGTPQFHPDLMKAFEAARVDSSVIQPALDSFMNHNGGASAYVTPETSIMGMPTASEEGMPYTTDAPPYEINSGALQPDRIPGTPDDHFLKDGDHELDHFRNGNEIPQANIQAMQDFVAGIDPKTLDELKRDETGAAVQSFLENAYRRGDIPTRSEEYESDAHANNRYAEHFAAGRATDPRLPDYDRWKRAEESMMDGQYGSTYTVNGLSPLAGEKPLTPHEIPVAENQIMSAAQRVQERIDGSILDTLDDQGEFDPDKQRLKAQTMYQETRRALAVGELDDLPYGKKVAERFVEGAERYAPEYYGVAPEDIRNDLPQMPQQAYGIPAAQPSFDARTSGAAAPALP